jgi:hypothetical protein
MANVRYDREIEPESDLKVGGKLLPGDARRILLEFGGTEKTDISVAFSPDNQDDSGSAYASGPALHEFDDVYEAQNYLQSAISDTIAQPVEEFDNPLYHTELGEDALADTTVTSIPNPHKINLDGEIEGAVNAFPREGDRNGIYHVGINFDLIGSSGVDDAEYMNDGQMSVESSGKYIKADSENQFEEIQQVAKDFEDFMSALGEL